MVARNLWLEHKALGLPESLQLHTALMQIMAITDFGPGAVHQHFMRHVFRRFAWDTPTAMCLLAEYYDLPDRPQRDMRVCAATSVPCDIPSGCSLFTSPVLPFACRVGSLCSDGRCGRCSCWCRVRGSGVQQFAYWGLC